MSNQLRNMVINSLDDFVNFLKVHQVSGRIYVKIISKSIAICGVLLILRNL